MGSDRTMVTALKSYGDVGGRELHLWHHRPRPGAAHRGWARLLLDRARDLIIYGPAHRGTNTNGEAMPTDEDDQDGNFFFYHPERASASSPCYSNSNLYNPIWHRSQCCGVKWGARVLRVRSVSREEVVLLLFK